MKILSHFNSFYQEHTEKLETYLDTSAGFAGCLFTVSELSRWTSSEIFASYPAIKVISSYLSPSINRCFKELSQGIYRLTRFSIISPIELGLIFLSIKVIFIVKDFFKKTSPQKPLNLQIPPNHFCIDNVTDYSVTDRKILYGMTRRLISLSEDGVEQDEITALITKIDTHLRVAVNLYEVLESLGLIVLNPTLNTLCDRYYEPILRIIQESDLPENLTHVHMVRIIDLFKVSDQTNALAKAIANIPPEKASFKSFVTVFISSFNHAEETNIFYKNLLLALIEELLEQKKFDKISVFLDNILEDYKTGTSSSDPTHTNILRFLNILFEIVEQKPSDSFDPLISLIKNKFPDYKDLESKDRTLLILSSRNFDKVKTSFFTEDQITSSSSELSYLIQREKFTDTENSTNCDKVKTSFLTEDQKTSSSSKPSYLTQKEEFTDTEKIDIAKKIKDHISNSFYSIDFLIPLLKDQSSIPIKKLTYLIDCFASNSNNVNSFSYFFKNWKNDSIIFTYNELKRIDDIDFTSRAVHFLLLLPLSVTSHNLSNCNLSTLNDFNQIFTSVYLEDNNDTAIFLSEFFKTLRKKNFLKIFFSSENIRFLQARPIDKNKFLYFICFLAISEFKKEIDFLWTDAPIAKTIKAQMETFMTFESTLSVV